MITVYGKPRCAQCDATERLLGKLGVPYEKRDVTTDGDALLAVTSLGYTSVPVVVTEQGDSWSGFRPDRLEALVP